MLSCARLHSMTKKRSQWEDINLSDQVSWLSVIDWMDYSRRAIPTAALHCAALHHLDRHLPATATSSQIFLLLALHDFSNRIERARNITRDGSTSTTLESRRVSLLSSGECLPFYHPPQRPIRRWNVRGTHSCSRGPDPSRSYDMRQLQDGEDAVLCASVVGNDGCRSISQLPAVQQQLYWP
ncbi:hypothetical protein VTN77DRAFT_3337 [Rasamsonia byssochlamydoides]|uniref:uncharacterized protein n=1 Tax=Rasamsonia byssochlamydoides TaxID=89139 RepID=UPI003743152C